METNSTREIIFKEIVSEIPLNPEKVVYGISFIAGPGMGKSTVAKKISEKLNLYITENDRIRRIMEKYGYDGENEHLKLSQELSNDRTIYMLENRTSMIIDANLAFFYQMALDNFNKYSGKIYFVEINCSEKEILRRIEVRKRDFSNTSSRADKDKYFEYREKIKSKPVPKELIFYTIDSEKDLDYQIHELSKKIKDDLNE